MGCGHCDRPSERLDILTERITSYEQFYEEIARGHRLVVLEETVVDIGTFLSIHPGGSDVLKANVGKRLGGIVVGTEISRYYYGGFRFRGRETHTHSEASIHLLTNMSAGTIKSALKPKIFRPIKQQPEEALEKEVWKLVSKKMLSSSHGVFQFRSPNYKVAAILPYFDHCGKYFTVHPFL